MKHFLHSIFTLFFFCAFSSRINAQKLAVTPYVSGFTSPIDLKNCGDDRLFVAERTGVIRIINADGTLRPTPFLDISTKISSATEGEEGFLGLAFSPTYKTDGKFYVDYTANISGQLTSVVEQYSVSAADSNVADASSAITVLTQEQPFTNHNGGNLMFGKDGYLYINFGDGGSGGDPNGNAQNKTTFLGKILRIDVSKTSATLPYEIPPSNPFFTDPTSMLKKEIWIYGVRNPWRSSVDKLTGDLLIADVGQNKVEEIDFQAVSDTGGENYGWNIVEGDSCFNPSSGCSKNGITMPIYEYFHNGNSAAVTGGYVYRSAQSKALWGQYIFGDYLFKWIDAFHLANGTVSGDVTELISPAEATGNPISFGEDRLGDQYIIFDGNGTIYKLQDTSYLRRPKAYLTSTGRGDGTVLLQGWQGRNLTYQWLRNNAPLAGATSPDYVASGDGNYALVVTNDLNHSDTSDVFTLGALPLSLTSFTAQKTGNATVQLQWKTASELNVRGFTVLRRANDETAFIPVGYVNSQAPNGTSNNELVYSFTDSLTFHNSKLFYRLQVENLDGTISLSGIRVVNSEETKLLYTFYPNPAKGQFTVFLNRPDQPVVMSIIDNTGQKVKEQLLSQERTTVNLSGLKGVYIIRFRQQDGSNLVQKKLVVQ